MGIRQRIWARNERARLIRILGSKCRICASAETLTMDCIQPSNDGHHSLDLPRRISYYRAEMRAGNLQLLCHFCNSCKSGLGGEEWRTAFQWVWESSALQRLTQPPGGGTGLTGASARECLAEIVRRIYATRKLRRAI